MLEAGLNPALCRNGDAPDGDKSDTARNTNVPAQEKQCLISETL
jgi:hypothetical protein